MKGILMAFECPSCGAIFRKEDVIIETPTYYKINKSNLRCGCGRKGNFNLLKFEEREVKIYKEENENEN